VVPLRPALYALGSPGHVLFLVLMALPLVVIAFFTVRRLRDRQLELPVAAALSLVAVTLVVGPGWHHYFAFLPFALAVAIGRCGAPERLPELCLALASWLVSALPILLLADVPKIYFYWSAWGGTTLSALLVWWTLLRLSSARTAEDERTQSGLEDRPRPGRARNAGTRRGPRRRRWC
jgi:hypothetical protein